MTRFLLIIAAIIGAGCEDGSPRSDQRLTDLQPLIARAESTYSQPALAYLRQAFDTLSAHHVYGAEYDWEELWLATLEHGEGATTQAQTHSAIRFAIRDLDDPHSGFHPSPSAPDTMSEDYESPTVGSDTSSAQRPRNQIQIPPIKSEMVAGGFAYLEIPRFASTDSTLATAYASNMQDLIQRLDESGACGWIIDLRRNTGGNMWPMVAGVGPLLAGEHVGGFVDAEGSTSRWTYRGGRGLLDGEVLASMHGPAYTLRDTLPPVAVLTSSRTGSSAEAVAVAFQNRPNTRFFGKPTAGAATAPSSYQLDDGAWFYFSTHYYADREGTVYPDGIEPDVVVDTTMWDDHRVARRRAAEWLQETEACR